MGVLLLRVTPKRKIIKNSLPSQFVCFFEMSESLPKEKSEKNMKNKKNTTKTRRPKVGDLVEKYIKRIYNITGINPMKMVKGKDGKMTYKNINTVRKLVRKKFSHLDSHGLNKHIKAFYGDEKNQSLTRKFEPFGSNITNDISNLIERFNTNVPFIKPNAIKLPRKYDDLGIPLPIEVKYDYDDMRFDKYSGIENDAKRYAVDIVNEVFKDARGEQPDKMRMNVIDSIHNIKLETDPNESREDIENRYKKDILRIVNNILPYLYTLNMKDDVDAVKNQLNDLKQKLLDRIEKDDFDVDDDPIENYREAVEYGVGKMMSGKLTEDLKKDLDDIYTSIAFDEDREYSNKTIDDIYHKLQHFSENIALKQIDGIVVDRELRRDYHEVIPKIKKYLLEGIKKYIRNDDTKYNNMEYIYNTYLTEYTISNAAENTDDKEVDLLRDINKPIDAKGGLRDQIVNEATTAFNDAGQTTRKTNRKNIDQNMIANIIANKLGGVNDVKMNTIKEVSKDVFEGIKGKNDQKGAKSLAVKTRDIMVNNIVDKLFDLDEFRNVIGHQPMNSMLKYVNIEPIDRFEMIPPEEKANRLLKEATNRHQDVIENVMMDGKEESEDEEHQEYEVHQED